MVTGSVTAADLCPGDVLLYRPTSVFGWLIRLKTWHAVSHVEVYVGNSQSAASRDNIGVNVYPWRNTELIYVLRPTRPFSLERAMAWFGANAKGHKYGWVDLGAFMGLPWKTDGYFCSEFATAFLRAGGLPVFNNEEPRLIAPFEFLDSECLGEVCGGPAAAA